MSVVNQRTDSLVNGIDHPPKFTNPGKTPLVEFPRSSLEILKCDLLEAEVCEEIRELLSECIMEDDHQIRSLLPLVHCYHLKGLSEAQSLLDQLGEYFRWK